MIPDKFVNVDYLHLFKNRKVVLKFDSEINGLTKKEVQQIIGERLGEDTFKYSIKFSNDPKNYRGSIRGFTKGISLESKKGNDLEMNEVLQAIKALSENLVDSKKQDPEKIITLTEKFYKTQLEFLTKQNEVLEKKLDKLEKDQSNNQGGLSEALMMNILSGMMGANGATQTAGKGINDNVQMGSVPVSFIKVFDQVDFSKIPDEKIQELAGQLNYLVKQLNLPMKG